MNNYFIKMLLMHFPPIKWVKLAGYWCKIVKNGWNIFVLISSLKSYQDFSPKMQKMKITLTIMIMKITNMFNLSCLLQPIITLVFFHQSSKSRTVLKSAQPEVFKTVIGWQIFQRNVQDIHGWSWKIEIYGNTLYFIKL